MFLLPYKQTPWVESVVEAMLYLLWDLRLKVGHSTRSVDDCVREAKADMTVRTALLETRFCSATHRCLRIWNARYQKDIVEGSAAQFVQAKLAEREARVTRSGGVSRYVVEPNVKEGKGGLRDLNTLFWIAKYVYRFKDPRELIKAGLFTREEFQTFQRCEEFLWRVRCHLHFATGRAEERLSFDLQRQIAPLIGYESHAGLSSVERFMKRYFLAAKDVGDLTAIMSAALEAQETKPKPMLDRLLGPFRRRVSATALHADFVIANDRVMVRDDDAFRRDPVNIIRLFWLADKHNIAIHPHATR